MEEIFIYLFTFLFFEYFICILVMRTTTLQRPTVPSNPTPLNSLSFFHNSLSPVSATYVCLDAGLSTEAQEA